MTISQLHQEFKIALDKVDSLNYPDILPEEIDVFLNTNILKFISQRVYGNNARKERVEETQKRFDDLLTLVTGSTISTFQSPFSGKPNSLVATLPSDYWHTLEEEAQITYLDCNSVSTSARVPVYAVTHDRYNKIIRDPFNKPDNTKVIRMGLTGKMELITATGITLTDYYLRYIKKPATVQYGTIYTVPTTDVQPDLPESTHKEWLAMAVTDCLEKIESKRTQSSTQLLTTLE